MQYVSGSNIRAGQIPSLPASLDPIKDWFKALPMQNTVYYIAGGVMRELPGKMNMIWGGEGKEDTGLACFALVDTLEGAAQTGRSARLTKQPLLAACSPIHRLTAL
jgi:hypothetical protein